MSYSASKLGQIAVATAAATSRLRGGSAPSGPSEANAPLGPDSISIVPDDCKATWSNIGHIPVLLNTAPAGVPIAIAFPFVKWTGADKTDALLDAFLPKTPRQILGSQPAIGSGYLTMPPDVSPVDLNWLHQYPTLSLSFFVVGFAPDTEAGSDTTRGTLWLAVTLRQATTTTILANALKRLVRDVSNSVGVTVNDGVNLWPGGLVTAKSSSDTDLLSAAYASAVSLMVVGAILVGTTVLSPSYIGGAIQRIAAPIQSASQHSQQTYQFVHGGGLEQLKSQVSQLVATSRTMDPVQAEAAIKQVEAAIGTVRATVQRSIADAQTVLHMVPLAQRQLPIALKQAALANAAPSIAQQGLSIFKQVFRCMAIQLAQASAQTALPSLQAQLAQATGPAQWIVANQTQITAALDTLDGLLKKLDTADKDLALQWWQRHYGPLPVWGWATVGFGVFMSGAVGLRLLRKRKPPTPNRRRRCVSRRMVTA